MLADTAEEIYEDLYRPGLYSELWFRWHGKPLMICDPRKASAKLGQFFTLRRAHSPFTMTNTPFAWYWEATYPQPYGYTDDPNKPEEVNVSVAQNLRARDETNVFKVFQGIPEGLEWASGPAPIRGPG